MNKRILMAGLSVLAFTSGTAQAQNANTTSSTGGTGNVAFCNNTGTSGNVCDIQQVGNNNGGQVNQLSNNNTGKIRQTGDSNSGTITQYSNGATATITQTGSQDVAKLVQRGGFNSASSNQTNGNGLGAVNVDIRQNNRVGSSTTSNSASATQSGAVQAGSGMDLNANILSLQQNGSSNSATSTQQWQSSGYFNTSAITQGGGVDAMGFATNAGQFGNNNTANVSQNGGGLSSTVNQLSSSTSGTVSGNSATVSMKGLLNQSVVTQQSDMNKANVTVQDGFNQSNTSTVTQRTGSSNDAFVSLARGDQIRSTIDQNGANNYSEVTVTGGVAGINSTTDAQPGVGAEGNKTGANTVQVNQNGGGSVAAVTISSGIRGDGSAIRPRADGLPRGLGNTITVAQNSTAAYAARGAARPNQSNVASSDGSRIAYTEFGSGSSNFTGSNGNYVETYQQGRFDTASVTQSDNANGSGVTYSNGQIGRARAAVYQNSSVGSTSITQVGDNYGEVTQGFGGARTVDQGGIVTLSQTDAGDIVTAGTPGTPAVAPVCDLFGNCSGGSPAVAGTPGTVTRQYNQALITQYGLNNQLTATQNARNAYLTAFQNGGSNLVLELEQGTGTTSGFSGATPKTSAISATTVAGASTNATANVTQGGTNNGARVRQDSNDSTVTVVQLGTGSGPVTAADFTSSVTQGTTNGGNVIIVAQQGSLNRATARQEATVGRSVCTSVATSCPASGNSATQNAALNNGTATPQDDFYFAGGSRSAEIDILQGGSSNVAIAVQKGLGQYARIEQAGLRNTASITQNVGANNATGVIRQTGNDNSYYIVQDMPGQYLSVTQTGSNNSSVTGRGPNGGGLSGFTPPPGS